MSNLKWRLTSLSQYLKPLVRASDNWSVFIDDLLKYDNVLSISMLLVRMDVNWIVFIDDLMTVLYFTVRK